VSSKPIVMKVEYAFCPNLTIIDTPGFILKVRSQPPRRVRHHDSGEPIVPKLGVPTSFCLCH
jgi:hypothetical protein